MKAVFVEKSSVNVQEVDMPNVESGGIIVQMRACGICGSDLEKVYGTYAKPSMRLGHEPAGIVAKIGNDVKGISVGDRVFTHHHVACGECKHCSRGEQTLCSKYSSTNLSPCGLAEHYAVPTHNVAHGGVLKLADSVSFEQATMIEPLACCLRAWQDIPCIKGDTVAVLGCGSTGIMHSMIAQSRGIKVVCTDTNEFRLDYARGLGDVEAVSVESGVKAVNDATNGSGADAVIVATSSVKAIANAIAMVRNGGTIMLFGVPSRGDSLEIDAGDVYARGITIRSSYAASDTDTRNALDMITDGSIDVGRLVTHRYTLDNAGDAFELARSGDSAMKVLVTA